MAAQRDHGLRPRFHRRYFGPEQCRDKSEPAAFTRAKVNKRITGLNVQRTNRFKAALCHKVRAVNIHGLAVKNPVQHGPLRPDPCGILPFRHGIQPFDFVFYFLRKGLAVEIRSGFKSGLALKEAEDIIKRSIGTRNPDRRRVIRKQTDFGITAVPVARIVQQGFCTALHHTVITLHVFRGVAKKKPVKPVRLFKILRCRRIHLFRNFHQEFMGF